MCRNDREPPLFGGGSRNLLSLRYLKYENIHSGSLLQEIIYSQIGMVLPVIHGRSLPEPLAKKGLIVPLPTITLRLGPEGLPLRGVCGHPLRLTNLQSPSRFPQERVRVEAASLSLCWRLLWKAKKED